MNLFFRRVASVWVLGLAPAASAVAGAADPARSVPGSSLPAYRSAFSDYKPLRDDKPGDWRTLNDAVKEEGMASMPAMDKVTHGGMPGMGKSPGHAMPMGMPKEAAAAGFSKAPAATASKPAMKSMPNMPGMPEHSVHDLPGSKR